MDFSAHASLLSCVLSLALAVAVATRHRVHLTHRAFFLLVLAIGGWNGASFAYFLTWRPIPLRILLVISFCIPPAAIHFLRRFFYAELPALRELRRFVIWTSILLGLIALLVPNRPLPILGTPVVNFLLAVSSFYLVVTFVYCSYLLHLRQEREERTVEKTRLRYLRNGALGVLAALVTDMVASAPWGMGFQETRIAAIALTGYAYFVYLSILDYRLLELQEILGKTAIVGAAGGLLALFYVLLARLAGDSFGVVYLYALIASLVFLLLYDPVRRYLARNLERLFFEQTFRVKELAEVIGHQMLKTRRPEELVSLLIREFSRLERVTSVSAYLWNPWVEKYVLTGAAGTNAGRLSHTIPAEPLIQTLDRTRAPLLREELESRQQGDLSPASREEVRALLEQMEALHAELVLPLVGPDRCLGFIAIEDERAIETYTDSEIASFESVVSTASVLLENFRAVEELADRERLASLGEMAAGLAHEIRNPLGSIKGAVQYLEDEPGLSEKSREFFGIIVEETNRLSQVVSDFLDYSRKPVLKIRPLDLGALAEKTLRQLELGAGDPRLKIVTLLAADLPPAQADPDRIKQVVINLLQNAVAVLPEGGDIRVSTGQDGDSVWIEVADSGPGMDKDTMEKIFTPFFTTREDGVGLGLAISHRIVESHGGSIEVRSSRGAGTAFRVKLPIAAPGTKEEAAPAEPVRRAGGVR
ncbi:MAG: ATP-binding protein [Bdellovibrionota bacterium]